MSILDLSQVPLTARDDLLMAIYRDLEKDMSTPEGRERIERKTAERLALQTNERRREE
ncbi:MAG: hypothetical protein IKS55_02395 [Oscillospiraceae bacterium]|nr:hypothetical protein [Oscillospiraceae bacterium]